MKTYLQDTRGEWLVLVCRACGRRDLNLGENDTACRWYAEGEMELAVNIHVIVDAVLSCVHCGCPVYTELRNSLYLGDY